MNTALQKLTCTATTPTGTACQARPVPDSSFCFFHHPERAEQRKLASRRGGQNHVTLVRRDDVQRMPLRTNEQVLDLIEVTIGEVRAGVISPKIANAIGFLANIRLHGLPMENVPEVIEDESSRVRELLMQFATNCIEKSKVYGTALPAELQEVAKAIDEYEKDGNRS